MRLPLRRKSVAAVTVAALVACAALLPAPAWADNDEDDAPDFVHQFPHPGIAVDPGFRYDRGLQDRLEGAVAALNLTDLAQSGRFGVALVDLADPKHPVLAEVRGGEMIYAASMPKIAVLYAAFQARKERRLVIDPEFRETLTQMCRVSSNCAASQAIQKVSFPYIASCLWESGLYDEEMGGGLWVGKAYGGDNDYWRRDPVADMSHGATAVSVAKLLTLMAQGRLVDAQSSREMLDILGNPGLHHKFVRGLDARPSKICRKSGSWRDWHGDAALIEREGKRYVAVALMQTPQGGHLLEQLILRLDDCIDERPGAVPVARAAASTPAPVDPRGY